ncbi:MAG TPA: hypothetical protein PK403_11145, partial [Plasticicumulans sp.]|nr:hypothetical protein [Plasticicumulans sp.]
DTEWPVQARAPKSGVLRTSGSRGILRQSAGPHRPACSHGGLSGLQGFAFIFVIICRIPLFAGLTGAGSSR